VKVIYFILALYVSALSVYPCYEDDCVNEFSIANHTDEADHEEEDTDPCTPFCISACCTIHVFCSPQFNSLPVFQKAVTQNSNYTITFAPLVVVSIWQPPKLA